MPKFVSTFFPSSFVVSRKNLQVIARASRSFCWTFSSTIFDHTSAGSFPRSSSQFSDSILPRKVNKSSFAPATAPLPPSWPNLPFFPFSVISFEVNRQLGSRISIRALG